MAQGGSCLVLVTIPPFELPVLVDSAWYKINGCLAERADPFVYTQDQIRVLLGNSVDFAIFKSDLECYIFLGDEHYEFCQFGLCPLNDIVGEHLTYFDLLKFSPF